MDDKAKRYKADVKKAKNKPAKGMRGPQLSPKDRKGKVLQDFKKEKK